MSISRMLLLMVTMMIVVVSTVNAFVVSSSTPYSCNAITHRLSPARLGSLSMASDEKEKAEVIGKPELVDLLREKTGMMKKDVEILLQAFTETVTEKVLTEGKELRIRDLGYYHHHYYYYYYYYYYHHHHHGRHIQAKGISPSYWS